VTSIVVDPRNPGTAYAAVDERGVLRRTAEGWHAAVGNKGLESLSVGSVAVDASNPATFYLETETGVFKYTDGAASWQPAPAAWTPLALRDPHDPGTLYLERLYGLSKSTDGGASWQGIGPTGTTEHALALDPKEPATLYAGTDDGLYTSANGGASWRALGGRLADAEVHAVAVDPREPRTIYAGTVTGVFVSTDRGASWSSLSRGLPLRTYSALAVDPAARLLYAGTLGAGIYELRLPR
jgi:ligand-binding sensor domain-containing protein